MSLYPSNPSRPGEHAIGEAPTFQPESIRTIGNYTVERVLASSLIADVFLGTEQATGMQVAIKMLRAPALRGLAEQSVSNQSPAADLSAELAPLVSQDDENETPSASCGPQEEDSSPDGSLPDEWFSSQPTSSTAAARIAREWQFMKALRHPHIVAAKEAGEHQGIPYLAMEYVAGGDMHQTVAQSGSPPIAQTFRWVRQIASALQYIHDAGIVHRDLKPSNVLMRSADDVCLGDFGIARAEPSLLEQDTESNLTMPGALLGTPDYMAPEQIECSSQVDHRADLYSLGCLFYYLLYGTAPFSRHSGLSAKLVAHSSEAIALPVEPLPCARNWQDGIEALLRRLLAKSPADRPSSATAVIEAISEIQNSAVAVPPKKNSRRAMLLGACAAACGLAFWRRDDVTRLVEHLQPAADTSPRSQAAQAVAPEFKLEIEIPTALPDSSPPVVSVDSPLAVRLSSSRDCTVFLFRRGVTGSVDLLLPNQFDTNNYLLQNKPRLLPRQEDGWELFLAPPLGQEELVAVAVSGPGQGGWSEARVKQLIAQLQQQHVEVKIAQIAERITAQADPQDVAISTLSLKTIRANAASS